MKHVVIVGGGFADVRCAQALAHSGKVRVTLIDRHNYQQFKPLLYQVAISELTPRDVGFSLRKIFRKSPNVDIKLALLTGLRVNIETFLDWVGNYFSKGRGPQLIDRSDAARIDWQDDDNDTDTPGGA
jgi:NADH:ubiquinone reductase (H+-translocating)